MGTLDSEPMTRPAVQPWRMLWLQPASRLPGTLQLSAAASYALETCPGMHSILLCILLGYNVGKMLPKQCLQEIFSCMLLSSAELPVSDAVNQYRAPAMSIRPPVPMLKMCIARRQQGRG